MFRKEDSGIAIAGRLARDWSNEILIAKSADDLVRSFGITAKMANSILDQERNSRGLK